MCLCLVFILLLSSLHPHSIHTAPPLKPSAIIHQLPPSPDKLPPSFLSRSYLHPSFILAIYFLYYLFILFTVHPHSILPPSSIPLPFSCHIPCSLPSVPSPFFILSTIQPPNSVFLWPLPRPSSIRPFVHSPIHPQFSLSIPLLFSLISSYLPPSPSSKFATTESLN